MSQSEKHDHHRFEKVPQPAVVTMADIEPGYLENLLKPYGLAVEMIASDHDIPGSFWGDEEAGLIGNTLYVRPDTPVHSALHEASHYICMDAGRRENLETNAGGGYDEENGVCYLQILLAGELPGSSRERMMTDMDAWGYSFRLGSAQSWFYQDAEDARNWLIEKGIIDESENPTWKLRGG
jgi:hypothetical protein